MTKAKFRKENATEAICVDCGVLQSSKSFYAPDLKYRPKTAKCKSCKNRWRHDQKIKKQLKQTVNASISFLEPEKEIVSGIFYIPDIILVGIGREQTYQHVCLNCNNHFFNLNCLYKQHDLFCDNCLIEENKIKEKNISEIKYFGNVVGWKVVTEVIGTKKRTQRNYKKVYIRDKYTCQYCNYNLENATVFLPLHIDHIKPWAAGGSNSMENLCVSCQNCNLCVSDKWFNNFQEKKQYILLTRKIIQSTGTC